MWYLATCDDTGRCVGFLKEDMTVSTNPDKDMNKLMRFKRKKDTSEIVLQHNLGRMLLPNRSPYRIVAVKV